MDLIVLIFSFLCVLGLIDKIIQRWGLAQYVDAAVFAMSSTILPYIGICCVGAVLVGKLTQVLSVSESYLPAIIIGSLLSPDLGGFKLCQEIVREQEWFFFCSLILAGCIGQFISFQLPIFSSTIHDSQDILIQGFIAGIIAAPAGILTGGVVIGIQLLSILCNCLPVWAICILIAVGFLKRPALTQRVLKMFGEVLQSLCIGLFAAVVILLQINPDSILGHLADSMVTFIKMLVIVIGGTILSALIQKCLKVSFTMKVFHLDPVSFSGILLNSISSVAMSPLWPQMSPLGKRINAAFAVSGAYMLGGQMTFAIAAENSRVLAAFFSAKIVAGALSILITVVQSELFMRSEHEMLETK